jgi:hypothetical protein
MLIEIMIPQILSPKFKNNIQSIIKIIFVNLNGADINNIKAYAIIVIQTMAFKYGFKKDTIEQFYTLMTQNNNQHIKSIIKLLLPYIDDINNFQLFAEIEKLSDITIKKKPGMDLRANPDINPYLISTYQYSKYHTHNIDNVTELNKEFYNDEYSTFMEYKYNEYDLKYNALLLLDTIELTRTKLLVNWLDIIPIVKQDYKESRLYKNSFTIDGGKIMHNGEKLRQWTGNYEDSMITYSGISPHDMFNGTHVYLFNEIFNSGVKWLMYEKQINKGEKPVTYIEILNDIVNIKYLSDSYTSLSNTLKEEIENRWKSMKTKNEEIYKDFIKCIIFKFDLNYCKTEINDEYNYDSKTFYEKYEDKERKRFNDEDKFLDLDLVSINSSDFHIKVDDFFNKIPFLVLHDFFNEQIIKFKRTWYGQNMLRLENGIYEITSVININENLKVNYIGQDNTFYLTYKNIYNYAKYISLNVCGNSNITDSRSLNFEQWKTFFNILNNEHTKSFNINKVILKTYGATTNNDINGFQTFIDTNFKETFKDNIFLIFIGVGLLSEIVPNPSLTDKSLLGETDIIQTKTLIDRVKKLYIKNKENSDKYLDTEYYLTREKYKNLELYKGRYGKEDDTKINWFEHMTMGEPWYNYFALSLISQINFYHHFLNNRVMMVTGSTGQGKSVIVPILFYYANIALTLNSRTKVLSTQALVAATTSNSKFMALNLGVPIDINGFETTNPYIQYSTQDDKHNIKGSETYIKEVTDRTLLEELQTNPLLKKPGDMKDGKVISYRDDNLYDVIIIDEAHMHNVSMDLILSIIRNTIMINNQIRLVITSATMDADEFIYRRFYKNINDNYMYPMFSKSEFTLSKKIIDRSCVDRRFHISPPGETSRYTVTDIYRENEVKTYEEAEILGIETLNRIIGSTVGDILFFTTTTKLVAKLVRLFNTTTAKNIIALPLYSKMRELEKDIKWFDTIKEIDKNISSIIYRKEDIMDIIETGVAGFPTIKTNTYDRAIIIATPVVEASVTIGSLTTVIDTGYVVNINFDVVANKNIQSIDIISDASRLQRRGRVGRKASGTVYYMYKKGSREHIKPGYEIVTKDITFDLFKILSNESIKKFADFNNHPQNYKFINGYDKYNEFLSKEENVFIKSIYDKQYKYEFANTSPKHPFINTNITSLPKNLANEFGILYNDGYGITDLKDIDGKFYIIHPGENYIKRDVVTGTIIESNINSPIKFPIEHFIKIDFSLQKMQFLRYIYYDKQFKMNKESEYINDKYVHKHNYINLINDIIREEATNLSDIGNNFAEIETVKVIKTICIGYKLNCLEKVIKIIALMYSIGTYKTFIRKRDDNPKKLEINEFKNRWTNNVSELLSYEEIMNKFIESRDQDSNIKPINNIKINERNKKYENLMRDKGMSLFADTKNIDNSELSKEEIKIFTESKNRRYTTEKRNEKFKILVKNVTTINDNEMFAKIYHVDAIVMNRAVRLYNKLKKIIEKPKVILTMEKFKDIYTINNSKTGDNVIIAFMDNYGSNLLKYSNGEFAYVLQDNVINSAKISLMNSFDSYYFYTILSDEGMLGLTAINLKTIKETFNIASYGNITDEAKEIKRYPDIIATTSKINIVKKENSNLDMNNIIKADLNFK